MCLETPGRAGSGRVWSGPDFYGSYRCMSKNSYTRTTLKCTSHLASPIFCQERDGGGVGRGGEEEEDEGG